MEIHLYALWGNLGQDLVWRKDTLRSYCVWANVIFIIAFLCEAYCLATSLVGLPVPNYHCSILAMRKILHGIFWGLRLRISAGKEFRCTALAAPLYIVPIVSRRSLILAAVAQHTSNFAINSVRWSSTIKKTQSISYYRVLLCSLYM